MLSFDLPNLLFTVINLLVLYLLLKLFLFKPVRKILEKRQAIIESELSEAVNSKIEALALEKQHKEAMNGIEDEKASIFAAAKDKAAEESDLIVMDAKQHANDIIRKAESEALDRKKLILKEAQMEISDIIIEATKKVSGVSSNNMLYDEFFKKVGETDGKSS